jgi:hypothetical protein
MTRTIIFGLIGSSCLAIGSAEAAACHHFSRWHYPWPQRCGAAASRPATAEDRSWYVEITVPPKLPKPEDERERGIDQLKDMLR